MKKYIKYLLLCLFAVGINSNLHSQQNQTTIVSLPIDTAMLYLTGTFKKYNPSKAFTLFLQRANLGEAKAMNAVALQYAKGLGVDSNFNLAVFWFKKAAANGYSKALVNLGMLYKNMATDSASYSIAFSYFNQALQANEPSAYFAQGYMHYKGLGCTQSYTTALHLFDQGIANNQPNCMYFKGLCYKFGYGILTNIDSANFYIDSAAQLGYKQANAQMFANNTNTSKSIKQNIASNILPTTQFIPISKSQTSIVLSGTFTGTITQYDYSGKTVVNHIPATLQLSTQNNALQGSWQLGNNAPIGLQGILQGNQILFTHTNINGNATTKYSNKKEQLFFKNATLQIKHQNDSSYITGSLQLYNNYTHETDKPINISLVQLKNKQQATPLNSNINIYPNPVNNSCHISINLSKASAVKINIYNGKGTLVYNQISQQLQAGKQTINIPQIQGSSGVYIATISTNYCQQSVAFIKE
jgi:uncharacterized protein